MKQSHNALTYLRAQYRAIYGRAYIKGLATAMIVTSAFATSMAHAANINIDFGPLKKATPPPSKPLIKPLLSIVLLKTPMPAP